MTSPDESVDELLARVRLDLERMRSERITAIGEAIEVVDEILRFRAAALVRRGEPIDFGTDRVLRGLLCAGSVLALSKRQLTESAAADEG